MKVGVSGEIGSFSEEAGLQYVQKSQLSNIQFFYLIDMEGVLAALEDEKINLGIFPVVNLRGGLVTPAFIAMGKHRFEPVDELWLDVQQCLMTKPGLALSEIQTIASHPQGLAQCQHYLRDNFPSAPQQPWEDTAKAAKDLSEGILDRTCAVIAPERCAQLYQLEIKAKAIQDDQPNLTAFIMAKPLRSKAGEAHQ